MPSSWSSSVTAWTPSARAADSSSRPRVRRTSSAPGPCSSAPGPCSSAPGPCSPCVMHSSDTSAPRCAHHASVPPQARDSSSGCANTASSDRPWRPGGAGMVELNHPRRQRARDPGCSWRSGGCGHGRIIVIIVLRDGSLYACRGELAPAGDVRSRSRVRSTHAGENSPTPGARCRRDAPGPARTEAAPAGTLPRPARAVGATGRSTHPGLLHYRPNVGTGIRGGCGRVRRYVALHAVLVGRPQRRRGRERVRRVTRHCPAPTTFPLFSRRRPSRGRRGWRILRPSRPGSLYACRGESVRLAATAPPGGSLYARAGENFVHVERAVRSAGFLYARRPELGDDLLRRPAAARPA